MGLQKLSDFTEIIMGQSPKGSSYNENGDGYPLLNGAADYKGQLFKPKKYTNQPTRLVEEGDILLGIRATIGNFAFADKEYCIGRGVAGIRVNAELADKNYIKRVVENELNKILHTASGSTIKGIKKEDLTDMIINLPPLATQKKIAAILDEADKLRQLGKQLIEKYDALTQSLFLDMFGDPVTNPKGWEKIPMSSLMKIVRGGSPRPIDKFLGGTYPWIKIGDATKGNDIYLESTKEHIIEEGLKKTRLLPKGSLIFANCGVSLGFARILTFEGCIHDGWLAFSEIDNKKLNEIFLLKALNSITRYFRETAPDGTQPNLNIGIMSKFEIILPPVELQNKFEKSLFEIEAQKAQAQQSLQQAGNLFNSLLQKAFKGELV